MKKSIILPTLFLCFFQACNNVPGEYFDGSIAGISPDYANITVPSNIAPVNFMIKDEADQYLTVLQSGSENVCINGAKVCIPQHKWQKLIKQGDITVTIYEKHKEGWTRMKPFTVTVADEIDRYLTYRVIPPSFETYRKLSIVQRDLTCFIDKVVYSNSMTASGPQFQCINCHSFRNWKTDNMQFHIRGYLGGTVLYTQNQLTKLNFKTDSVISSGVYPSWHPTHDYIAYSTNNTFQNLHTVDNNRVEVFDERSDLILYDLQSNSISIIENSPSELECFPYWSADGKTLYYVSANIGNPEEFYGNGGVSAATQDIRYNLYAKQFNPENRTWGKSELIIRADSLGKSITLPRTSPDGRWLMFTMGNQGVFHIWHKDSELGLLDLKKGGFRMITEINSPDVESYHSWSSTGKWIVFSSRREDGLYTRLYLTYMNSDGTFTKPFLLPQKDPEFSSKFMYSFNIPEFTVEPVRVSAKRLASLIKGKSAAPVNYIEKRGE